MAGHLDPKPTDGPGRRGTCVGKVAEQLARQPRRCRCFRAVASAIRLPQHRLLLVKQEVFEIMSHLTESLDYDNFKSMVAATPDQRMKLNAYHEVWHTMAQLQKS